MDLTDVARNIKALRQKKNLTLDMLAEKTGTTKGFLSQLENYRTSLSLPILYKIAEALEEEPATLLKSIGKYTPYALTRAGTGLKTEREYPESGFKYFALAKDKSLKMLDPFLLELPPGSKRKNVTTNGDEFIYVLEGSFNFFLDNEEILMKEGDSLYFDGSIPHHPENNSKKAAKLIVIYALNS